MKIAAITEDRTNISQHFGRAPMYIVVTVENGKVINKEIRDKAGHNTFAAHDGKSAPGERHGFDAGSQVKHITMAEVISDCQVLLAGGMGWGAYENLKSHGITPVITDVETIDEAVKLHLEGKLPDLTERLH